MNNTINSLAILKVNWDKYKKDYIENYVPFFVHLIKKINYCKIDANKIRKDFLNEYGINLPYHPTLTILNRLKQHGYIKKLKTYFAPDNKILADNDFEEINNQQQRKLNNLISAFIEYTSNYNIQHINQTKAEDILISYLNDNALEILFSSHQNGVLPEKKVSKSDKYIFNQFVLYLFERNDYLFSSLVDISVGHILANTILYNEFNKFLGELSGNHYYLDVPILLELLGANGIEKKQIYEEFIATLTETGIKLYIFEHTQSELLHNLNNCLNWVENPLFNPEKASRTLNYFVLNNYTESDIEKLIVSIPKIFKRFNIKVISIPDYKTNIPYQIDELKLKEKIIKLYKDSDHHFNENEKDYMLQNDVDSISAIYRLRQGNNPTNIEDAKHIFITKNSTLAYVAFKYQTEFSEDFTISSCLTDTFIGTLIWLKSPAKLYSLNVKKMIADVYAALQPDRNTIKRYLSEINKLRKSEKISPEDYYLLRSHRVTMNLLQEKILGDPEKYTDQTPEELIVDLKNQFKKEGEVKYIKEKNEHQKTISKLSIYNKKINFFSQRIEQIVDIISRFISYIIAILCLAGLIFNIFIKSKKQFTTLNILLIIIYTIFGFLGLYSSFNIKNFRNKLKKYLKEKILNFFLK